jgi:protein transport protein SEC13
MSGQMIGSFDTSNAGVMHDVQLDYYAQRVAAASAEGQVHIWDISDGQQKPVGQPLKGHEGPVWKFSWAHPKFGQILASCGYDMKVIVWKEVQPGSWQIAYVDNSHTASVNDIEFCPWEHGLRLACASSDGTVSILTYQPDGQWRRTNFPANTGGSQAISWAPVIRHHDGSTSPNMRLVTGGCDNSACVWKCENEAWSQEFPPLPAGHRDWVRDVAWRPMEGASVIASGSWDKTVIICSQEQEGQQWRQLCTLTLSGKVESLSWCESGSILGVSYGENETALYKEAYDGRYEEIGKCNEPGYVEVPSSITAAMAASAKQQNNSPNNPGVPQEAVSAPNAELQQQQQNVLDSFGMM